MAAKFYLEKRASKRTGEAAIRASLSIKGVKLITTTGISIKEENWFGDCADEEKNKNGRRKSPVDYKNVKGQTCKDIFKICFCAFTSLRYSDMAALKRTYIDGDTMYITTQKTNDRLPINLNKYAKENA